MGADIEDDAVGRDDRAQHRHERAVMLLEDRLEEMGEEAGIEPEAEIAGRAIRAAHPIAFRSPSSSLSRNCVVVSHGWSGPMRMARSLVM